MNNDIINFLKFVQLDSYNIDYENTDVWVPMSANEETIVHLYLKPDEKEIINSFITVNGKRNSNGQMESLNGR